MNNEKKHSLNPLYLLIILPPPPPISRPSTSPHFFHFFSRQQHKEPKPKGPPRPLPKVQLYGRFICLVPLPDDTAPVKYDEETCSFADEEFPSWLTMEERKRLRHEQDQELLDVFRYCNSRPPSARSRAIGTLITVDLPIGRGRFETLNIVRNNLFVPGAPPPPPEPSAEPVPFPRLDDLQEMWENNVTSFGAMMIFPNPIPPPAKRACGGGA